MQYANNEWITISQEYKAFRKYFDGDINLKELEQLIMPLLVNLMKNPEKEYIYWPNRTAKIQEQIDKVLTLTRG